MKVTRGTIADEHGFSSVVQPQFLTFNSQAFAYELIQEVHLGIAQLCTPSYYTQRNQKVSTKPSVSRGRRFCKRSRYGAGPGRGGPPPRNSGVYDPADLGPGVNVLNQLCNRDTWIQMITLYTTA